MIQMQKILSQSAPNNAVFAPLEIELMLVGLYRQ